MHASGISVQGDGKLTYLFHSKRMGTRPRLRVCRARACCLHNAASCRPAGDKVWREARSTPLAVLVSLSWALSPPTLASCASRSTHVTALVEDELDARGSRSAPLVFESEPPSTLLCPAAQPRRSECVASRYAATDIYAAARQETARARQTRGRNGIRGAQSETQRIEKPRGSKRRRPWS
jgi:hypothetical protein